MLLLAAILLGALPLQAEELVFVEQGSAMRYLALTADPGTGLDWTDRGFDDVGWASGTYGVGHSAGGMIATTVREGTLAVYTRARFQVDDLSAVKTLHLGADYDDGYVAWINGVEVARGTMPAGDPSFSTLPNNHESSNGDTASYAPVLDITTAALPVLLAGENVLAAGVWNTSAESSDLALVPLLSANRPGPIEGTPLCGTLSGDVRLDASESPYTATCDLLVPADSTLTVEPGVEVYFDADVELRVEGRIIAAGEAGRPIVFTANVDAVWDGIVIDHGADGRSRDSLLRHARLSHASTLLAVEDTGDSPVIAEDCAFDYWDGNAIDYDGSHGLRIRRCEFGLETPRSLSDNETIHGARAGAVIEHSTFGPRSGYNDVLDISDASWGEPVPIVRYNLFLGGDDDAIDFDGTDGWIIGNVVLDHWPRPGSGSANGGGITGDAGARPVIAHNIVYRCYHGIGFKNGAAPLVAHNLVLDCNVGVTFYKEDCDDAVPRGTLINNIVWNNRAAASGVLQNLVLHGRWWSQYCQDPGDQGTASVMYTLIEGGWPGEGNLDSPPGIADPEAGDFSLAPNSPALESAFGGPFAHAGADPAELAAILGADRDGVPPFDIPCLEDAGSGVPPYRDMGPLELVAPELCESGAPFLRGDANGDGAVDVSDPVTILLGLFAGRPPSSCPDASDATDDGEVNLTDAVRILDLLFAAGAPLAAPFPRPGFDPTEDGLGCKPQADR